MSKLHQTARLLAWIVVGLVGYLLLLPPAIVHAQDHFPAPEGEESGDERRERELAARFLTVLRRSPRLGTALDKIYGYHVGRGSLQAFSKSLEEEANNTNDGSTWAILGMVQMQRGQDALAVEALKQAEKHAPDAALVSFYLGRSLVLLGEVDEAAKAMQRAIEKKPARADMVQVFKELGRIYQRTGRNEQALSVWEDLESKFPGDLGVQEQIALILAEEGAVEAALERYTKLAASTTDRFRKVEMSIRAAQLKAKLGKTDEALADFENQLSVVNPTSWLHRDIRSRIEEVFWSSSDFDGLVDYYTNWNKEHPNDVDAMMRTARVLSIQKRTPEAREWFRKAIERAPSNVDARLALVDAFANDDAYAEAAKEMEAIVELEPENPDFLVRLGELVHADTERTERARAEGASAIWRRMLDTPGDDPVVVSRVADLLRGIELKEEAIQQYQAAIKLADDEPQYREYLGEYLHQLNRKDEAIAIWQQLAADGRRTLENMVRLSEVFSTFGYSERALQTIAQACRMKPGFGERARYAELLRESGQYDEALAQLDLAEPMADDRQLRELLISERVKNYQASGSLQEMIASLKDTVAGEDAGESTQWRLLSLYLQADRKFQAASDAISKACELSPTDPVVWESAASIYERTGRFGDAVSAYQKLAKIDRRFLSNYLTQIATLQMRLGNIDEALQTGEELLASAPGNATNYRFFAGLCTQAGESEKALDVLRRSVRSNPNDQDALGYLASTLASEYQTDEAIELYWRQFDSANGVDGKIPVVEQLAELYLRTNRFSILVERLETVSREENKKRDGVLWTAAAHQAAGDLGMARELLEQLVREDSRDTGLLQQLVTLSKAEYDFERAVDYQKRLMAISPSEKGEYLLASLLSDLGELDEAEALWVKLASRRSGGASMQSSIDSLMTKQQYELAASIADKAVSAEPNNWELLGSAMLAFAKADRLEDAVELGARVKKISQPLSAPTKAMQARMKSQQKQGNMPAGYSPYDNLGKQSTRPGALTQLRSFLGADSLDPFRYSSRRTYTPNCFGDVVTIALAVELLAKSSEPKELKKFTEEAREAAMVSKEPKVIWDAIAYQAWESPSTSYRQITPGQDDMSELLARLVELGDEEAMAMDLNRNYGSRNQMLASGTPKPLSEEKLNSLLTQLESVSNSQLQRSISPFEVWITQELELAGRGEEAQQRMDALLKDDQDPFGLVRSAAAILSYISNGQTQDADRRKKSIELVVPMLKNVFSKATPRTQNVQYTVSSAMTTLPTLCQYGKIEDVVDIAGEIVDLQGRLTADMRPSQRDATSTTQNRRYSTQINGNYVQLAVDFPPPSGYFSSETILSLYAAYKGAEASDKLDAYVAGISKLSQEESGDPYQAFARLMAKASVEHWSGNQHASMRTLTEADKLNLGTQFLSLTRARLQYASGDVRGALASIDALRPRNQRMLVDRELTLLSLVLQLGDLERAKKSAQKLFALRLDSTTEFQLSEIMYQLGMKEMGDRIMGRIRRRSGGKQETLVELMNRYTQAGELESASEIARQIIRRTEPAVGNVRTSSNSQHSAALQVLVRSGEIDSLTERYESLVKRSPKSSKLINQLAAMYEAKGRRTDAAELRRKLTETGSKNPQSMMAAAQQLMLTDKDKAIDLFLEAVERSPQLLESGYSSMRTTFREKKALPKLVDKIDEIGIDKFRNNYRISSMVYEMVTAQQFDSANKLLAMIIETKDWNMVSNAVRNVQAIMVQEGRTKFKYSDSISTSIADILCDSDALTSNVNVQLISSYGSDGRVNGLPSTLISMVSTDDKNYARVREHLEEVVSDTSTDFLQRSMLCMLHAQAKEFVKVRKVAAPLLEDESTDNRTLVQAKWVIASAVANKDQDPEFAAKLLESMDDLSGANLGVSGLSFTSLPSNLLTTAYENSGQKVKAKEKLVEAIEEMQVADNTQGYPVGYLEYNYTRSMSGLAQRLLTLDAPAEAFLAFSRAYSPEIVAASGRYSSNSASQRDRLQKSIMAKLTPSAVQTLVRSVITPPGEGSSSGSMLLDLKFDGASTVDQRATMPLRIFLKESKPNDKLLSALAADLQETPVGPDAPLQTLVARLIVATIAEHEPSILQSVMTIGEWMDANQRPGQQGDPANGSVTDEADQEDEANKELYLCVASETLASIAGMDELKKEASGVTSRMIDRSISAATLLGKEALVLGIQLQRAAQISESDPEVARKLYMDALDKLLPLEEDEMEEPLAGVTESQDAKN